MPIRTCAVMQSSLILKDSVDKNTEFHIQALGTNNSTSKRKNWWRIEGFGDIELLIIIFKYLTLWCEGEPALDPCGTDGEKMDQDASYRKKIMSPRS